ncbi:ATP phosphoribosyltransferase regulatory subunit [uncultured Tateyamaria sp.]|uniref:ATP phosphoribosyltransferase regulatory subunit n=1 Tax=Tateyamaria sp. 1078 TaxID=3417464 RepID=UPI00260AD844|nr:ATP phosphoribosyltransferase regulatory subunit [uncultured Tateyamaria sp.]
MIRARALALRDRFAGMGARVVEPPVLLQADVLLDLYGEDIRGRAYITADALRGEQMLRPDFTVPVVQMHLADGTAPARYTYAGEVFRKQEDDPERDNEYLQVGYEVFDAADPAAADAEVFATLADTVTHLPVRAATGDIGILMAAVDGLQTSDRRKAALRRHIWRPRRFRALLDRFGGRTAAPASRKALLAGEVAATGPLTGLRSQAEIDARIAALHEDAAQPPISAGEMEGLDALLNVRETLPFALQQLQNLAADLPSIGVAVARLRARTDALAERGVDVASLEFEASFGRTSMEYYDGFVFGFYATSRPDLPPVVSGGRYDALTRRLGGADGVPAVGGVIRPGLVVALEEAT